MTIARKVKFDRATVIAHRKAVDFSSETGKFKDAHEKGESPNSNVLMYILGRLMYRARSRCMCNQE